MAHVLRPEGLSAVNADRRSDLGRAQRPAPAQGGRVTGAGSVVALSSRGMGGVARPLSQPRWSPGPQSLSCDCGLYSCVARSISQLSHQGPNEGDPAVLVLRNKLRETCWVGACEVKADLMRSLPFAMV